MADKDRDARISAFVAVTGATPSTAAFYLDSASGDVDAALVSFYDNANGSSGVGDGVGSATDPDSSDSQSTRRPRAQATVPSQQPPAPRIATLSSHGVEPSPESNTYFAGGGRSGVAIQGPADRNSSSSEDRTRALNAGLALKSRVLSAAINAQYGGTRSDDDSEEDDSDSGESHGGKRKPFAGQGKTLGGGAASSSSGASATTNAPANAPGNAPQRRTKVRRTMTFYEDGFVLEGAEGQEQFYSFSEARSRDILERITQGIIPHQLLGVAHGQAVDLHVVQRESTKYQPKAQPKSSGVGRQLGSTSSSASTDPPASSSSSCSSSSSSSASSSSSSSSSATPFSAGNIPSGRISPAQIVVDSSAPTTRLQYRSPTGTRHVMTFNRTHTVRDIYALLAATVNETRPYVLVLPTTRQRLTDLDVTLEAAGVLNCVVEPAFS